MAECNPKSTSPVTGKQHQSREQCSAVSSSWPVRTSGLHERIHCVEAASLLERSLHVLRLATVFFKCSGKVKVQARVTLRSI